MKSIGSTVEISNVAPVLRNDLNFTLQKHGEQTCYLIEDEKNSRFYRIGIPEYTFISLLDGTSTIRDAMTHTSALLGNDAFTEADAATICKWLIDSQLAETDASRGSGRLAESSIKSTKAKHVQWLNPIILRLPLLRPDALVGWCTRYLGWWFSWSAFVVWIAVVLLAIHQLINHRSDLSAASNHVFAPGNLICLAVCWCVLKLFHELSHGIACKRFGGHVREAGIVLIALAPIPYVDVTSSWRFPNKWKRIFVSAAGMYTEIFLAAVATLVWANVAPGLVKSQAHNIMITASLVTVLFNANPLMRFDGYYMLSDFWEIPNLYGLGQHFTQYLGRKYVLGVKATLPVWSVRKGILIKIYGLCSFAWRIFICVSIMIGLSTLFSGAGIALALVAGILWIAVPFGKLIKYVVKGNKREKPHLGRFVAAVAVISLLLGGFMFMPEPGGIKAPGVVSYEPLHIVRAPYSGFVRQISTSSGDKVSAGECLFVIENQELTVEVKQLHSEYEKSKTRRRQFQSEQNIAATQVEEMLIEAKASQLSEQIEKLAQSSVAAPADGQVVTRDVESLLGTYVQEGEPLVAIGTESQKQLEVAIDQEDLEAFEQNSGQPVKVFFRSAGMLPLTCQLGTVDPRASRQLLSPSLAAVNGGPLAVQPRETQGESEEQAWELIQPRFMGKVTLTPEQSQDVRTGQTTIVRLSHSRGNMGKFLYRSVSGWIERRLDAVRGT